MATAQTSPMTNCTAFATVWLAWCSLTGLDAVHGGPELRLLAPRTRIRKMASKITRRQEPSDRIRNMYTVSRVKQSVSDSLRERISSRNGKDTYHFACRPVFDLQMSREVVSYIVRFSSRYRCTNRTHLEATKQKDHSH